MPPLIAVAGVIGGLAVIRWAYRAMRRVNQELDDVRRAMTEAAPPTDIPTLRKNPTTGAYRPG